MTCKSKCLLSTEVLKHAVRWENNATIECQKSYLIRLSELSYNQFLTQMANTGAERLNNTQLHLRNKYENSASSSYQYNLQKSH